MEQVPQYAAIPARHITYQRNSPAARSADQTLVSYAPQYDESGRPIVDWEGRPVSVQRYHSPVAPESRRGSNSAQASMQSPNKPAHNAHPPHLSQSYDRSVGVGVNGAPRSRYDPRMDQREQVQQVQMQQQQMQQMQMQQTTQQQVQQQHHPQHKITNAHQESPPRVTPAKSARGRKSLAQAQLQRMESNDAAAYTPPALDAGAYAQVQPRRPTPRGRSGMSGGVYGVGAGAGAEASGAPGSVESPQRNTHTHNQSMANMNNVKNVNVRAQQQQATAVHLHPRAHPQSQSQSQSQPHSHQAIAAPSTSTYAQYANHNNGRYSQSPQSEDDSNGATLHKAHTHTQSQSQPHHTSSSAAPAVPPVARFVDEDYDEGAADALMGLAGAAAASDRMANMESNANVSNKADTNTSSMSVPPSIREMRDVDNEPEVLQPTPHRLSVMHDSIGMKKRHNGEVDGVDTRDAPVSASAYDAPDSTPHDSHLPPNKRLKEVHVETDPAAFPRKHSMNTMGT
ncbi:hypothetical protein E3P86_04137, partial [Wallemia ichthyophaga]